MKSSSIFLSVLLCLTMLTVSYGSYGTTINDAECSIENPVCNLDFVTEVEVENVTAIKEISTQTLGSFEVIADPDTQGKLSKRTATTLNSPVSVVRLALYKQHDTPNKLIT